MTLIERDVYADTTEPRRGTPQANHVHALLLRGRQVLEELFPGLPAPPAVLFRPTVLFRVLRKVLKLRSAS